MTISFTDTTSYGMSSSKVMIQGIRVDQEIVNPFDPTHPEITSNSYNIPFSFDLATLHLIPDLTSLVSSTDSSTACASLSVFVSDAYSAEPISNALVQIGSSTAYSDTAGTATFSGLTAGSGRVQASAQGYDSADRQISDLSCTATSSVGIALSPTSGEGSISANQARIVLTWGVNPEDLDSHLTGPDSLSDGSTTDDTNRFHIYYANDTGDVAGLDVDDVTSYGPETITISPPSSSSTLRPGLYRYSVHHFYGNSDISNSNASVTLQIGGTTRTFTPPSGSPGENALWTVFELVVNSSGVATIYEINTFTADQSDYSVRSTRTGYGSIEKVIDFSRLPSK